MGLVDDAGTGGDLLELQATQSFVAGSAKTGARRNPSSGLSEEAATPNSLSFQNCSSKSPPRLQQPATVSLVSYRPRRRCRNMIRTTETLKLANVFPAAS